MEINNIDKVVRDSLKSRTIAPSNSAWERLSTQLDVAQEQKRKNWFLYAGYAASILLLISVAFFINTNDDTQSNPANTVVTVPDIDTTKLVQPTIKNIAPVETAIVKDETLKESKKPVVSKKTLIKKPQKKQSRIAEKKTQKFKEPSILKENSTTVIANNTSFKKERVENLELKNPIKNTASAIKKTKPFRIVIDSDALLYSVTHTEEEVKAYYAKYDINRDNVLKAIQKELKKANLKIDANSLLTDVEKTIDEDTFKRSFMQTVKGKITGLATAFANRNN